MKYKIVTVSKHQAFGISIIVKNNQEIADFCRNSMANGIYQKILEAANLNHGTPLRGYRYNSRNDGSFSFMMGIDLKNNEVNSDFDIITIESGEYAVFESKGTLNNVDAIYNLWDRINEKKFPVADYIFANTAIFEIHTMINELDYSCEIYIPIQKKNNEIAKSI